MGNGMERFRVSVEECLRVGGWWRARQRGWKKVEWLLCFLGTRMVFLGCFATSGEYGRISVMNGEYESVNPLPRGVNMYI
ncbi:hypothetical protein ACFX2H_013363 [Malus domestica]